VLPARPGDQACWWWIEATHEPDGATIASAPAKARTWLATIGTASRR
jgi:hypothetical protein